MVRALSFVLLSILFSTSLLNAQTSQASSLHPIQQNGRWGYIDQTGRVVIKPQFYWAEEFSEGLAAFENDEGLYGYIDETGKIVIPPTLERWSNFSEGVAAVAIKMMEWGYIDKTGKWVIEPQFAYANSFCDGLAPVRLRPGKGVEWLAGFEKTAIIDKTGKVIFEPVAGVLNARVSKGVAFLQSISASPVGGTSTSKLIDRSGTVIFEGENIELDGFSEGVAPVMKDGKWGYVDTAGKYVIEQRFRYAKSFSEGLAAVNIGENKWGYIDHSGKFVIPAKFGINELYGTGYAFSEGLALVYLGDNAVFINKKGETVLKPDVSEVEQFIGGLAAIKNTYDDRTEERGYINKRGKFVWGPTRFVYKTTADIRAQAKKREEKEGTAEKLTPLTEDEKNINYRDMVADQPDFTAEMSYFRSHYVSGSGFTYKLTRKGNRYRKESEFWTFVGETLKSPVRLNPDKTYTLMEGVTYDGPDGASDFDPRLLARVASTTFTPLGKLTIDGHECVKIAVKRENASARQEEIYLYAAKDLKNLVIVAQFLDSNATLVQRLQNISLDVPDELVQIPAGYKLAKCKALGRACGSLRTAICRPFS